jgi:hypothetical protein
LAVAAAAWRALRQWQRGSGGRGGGSGSVVVVASLAAEAARK